MKFGAVYRIECKDTSITEFYVGSCKNFYDRHRAHKSMCCNINSKEYKTYKYKFIRENGGLDNWKFKIIKKLPNTNKQARLFIEQFYKDILKPPLNSYDAYKTKEQIQQQKKQYQLDNKEIINDYKTQYDNNNREHLNNYRREYYKVKANCPMCGLEMNKGSISRHIKRKHN